MDTFHKLQVAFNERHQSLIKDGYRGIIDYHTKEYRYVKLRHANGNYVSIIAYYRVGYLVQRTNGIITHDEKMC